MCSGLVHLRSAGVPLLPSDTFVLLPLWLAALASQASPPALILCLTGPSPYHPPPLSCIALYPFKSQNLAWDRVGPLHSLQPFLPQCSLFCSHPLTCPNPLTRSLLPAPLSSRPGPLPISSSLVSWPSSSGSEAFSRQGQWQLVVRLFPHPLPSLFPLQPPLLSPRLLTHPLPLPLPPSFSPTSLFQLRTGSSGQFPHCSASGEETAPLR